MTQHLSRAVFCTALYVVIVGVVATSPLKRCGAHGNCIDPTGSYGGIDDYSSMLQVHMSVDRGTLSRTRGPKAKPAAAKGPAEPSGAAVEMATLEETIAELGRAGDVAQRNSEWAFHKLWTYVQTNVTEWWKRLQMKQGSPFDFGVMLFALASISTIVILCSLLAIRGKTTRNSRPRRCGALIRLFKGRPEIVAPAPLPLPEFHPAKHHSSNLKQQVFPRQYSREGSLQEKLYNENKRLQRGIPIPRAEQILLEGERQAQALQAASAAAECKQASSAESDVSLDAQLATHCESSTASTKVKNPDADPETVYPHLELGGLSPEAVAMEWLEQEAREIMANARLSGQACGH